jgi:hypothetical protein
MPFGVSFCLLFVHLGALQGPQARDQGGPICLLGSRRIAYLPIPPIKPTSPYLAQRATNLLMLATASTISVVLTTVLRLLSR